MKNKAVQLTITFLIITTVLWQATPPVLSAGLEINGVQIVKVVNDKLTVSWSTNQLAQGWLQVGIEPNQYPWSVQANTFETNHEATITLPKEKTTYKYRIIAENQTGERITSFIFTIKIDKFTDTKNPEFISVPFLLYSDNTHAYLTWQTNEHTKGVLKYSIYPDLSQSKTAGANTEKDKANKARLQLSRLTPNTTYYYELTISDDSKNTAKTAVLNFSTKSQADEQSLRFLNLAPLSNNDSHITDTTLDSSWTTSRPAVCDFFYGEKNKSKKKLIENTFETWQHNFVVEGLKPNTEYEYEISCRDVLGTREKTGNVLFRTRAPLVLGYEYNQDSQANFYGQKYQLVKATGGTTIYAIVNKQKYAIKSPSIFTGYGFKWSDIKTITQKKLDKYPEAKLVKTLDSPAVYFLYNSLKRKKVMLTESAFKSYSNNSFNKVITISPDDLEAYHDIVLVKDVKNSTVYLLQDSSKRPIVNMTALKQNGLAGQPIGLVSQKDLDSYFTAAMIE